MSEEKSVVYDLQTSWRDLHVPTFVAVSSAVYFGEQLIGHPVEVVRTRLQVSQKKFSWNTLKDVVRLGGGIKGLYVGFLPGTVGYLPGNAVYFLSYSFVKDRLQKAYDRYYPEKKIEGRQVPAVSFLAGLTADVAAVSLFCPVEVVSQRLFIQDQQKKLYSGAFDAARKIYAQQGVKGFYKGFGAILVNSLPASAIWWTVYEESKANVSKALDVNSQKSGEQALVVHNHTSAQLISGALAGFAITFITNPLDVIRTRLQTQDIYSHTDHVHGQGAAKTHEMYRNTLHAAVSIYKKEGIMAFMKGSIPRMVQYMILSSLGGYLYEKVVEISRKKTPNF